MARMVIRICKFCKKEFPARLSDVKRGWALYCNKSCKAKEQEKNTGQYKAYTNGLGVSHAAKRRGESDSQIASRVISLSRFGDEYDDNRDCDDDPSWDAHKDSW